MRIKISKHSGGNPVVVGVLTVDQYGEQEIDDIANEADGLADLAGMATESTLPNGYEWTGDEVYEIEQPKAETMTTTIDINIYRAEGEWFAALWVDAEYDSCDSLDLPGDATEEQAIAAAHAMPLAVDGVRNVRRVADIPR